MQSIRRQALSLTAANGFTRALGFLMRILLARLMPPEALGVMEMAHSVEMLALTPVTAGTPAAMSRLTAQHPADERKAVLQTGLLATAKLSLVLIAITLPLSPLISYLIGDGRTLPSLLVHTPCIMLLGLASVYQGWCFGMQQMRLPAFAECMEQLIRITLSVLLLIAFRHADFGIIAAVPGAAEAIAAACVLAVFMTKHPPDRSIAPERSLVRELRSLAAPAVASRLCTTGLRAFNAVLIPSCLRISGLSVSAATAQYGLLTGMAMPALMLPGIITGAISTAAAPSVTARDAKQDGLDSLVRNLRRTAFLIGLVSAACLIAVSDVIATVLFRTPEAAPLIRLMSPTALIMSIQQVQYGAIAGLGLQRRQLTGSIVGELLSTLLIAYFTPMPQMRLYGAAVAMISGQLITLIWGCCVLNRAISNSKYAQQV